MQQQKKECQIVFEISNEIANKIGGIYTVIASKAPAMQRLMGFGNYLAIGLYNSFKAKNDFEELAVPLDFQEAFSKIRIEGIDVKYGRWIGGGGVETILVDPSHLLDVPLITGKTERKADEIKSLLWDWFQIDSLWMPEVFDPMVSFGWATGVVIAHLLECQRYKDKNIVAHFHEWISGSGLLYLKHNNIKIATAFMTHATQLGRNIAMGIEDINEVVDEYLNKGETIPPQKAYQYQVEGTHQLEVVCAKNADILITVSEAVAREAECILGRKPDFVIPNGINFNTIAKKEELNEKHTMSRLKMTRFVEAYFNPYYNLDTENLLVIHISGRYEFHNKGIDVFLESLKEVNEQLKKSKKDSRKILAFIWVPAPVSGIKSQIVKSIEFSKKRRTILQTPLLRIEEWLSKSRNSFEKKLTEKNLSEFFKKEEIKSLIDLFEEIPKLKEKGFNFPPLCPFQINERDTIYQTLKKLDLVNKEEDYVKVIFYPTYLSKNDGLLELDYYDAVAGCDMGIYPSTYEPFGLTPLEAVALSVPAVTTDLAGFGLLVDKQTSEEAIGIHVLKRRGKTIEESANQLANIILLYSELSSEKFEEARRLAREISELYSWKNIIKEYKIAFDQAIMKL
ncbi:MAG TPA: glycosyltransferase [candidate division Zixibacteria bacterium]|nr:glycosyltransferase [candidate division Zixibacteria bacterium]